MQISTERLWFICLQNGKPLTVRCFGAWIERNKKAQHQIRIKYHQMTLHRKGGRGGTEWRRDKVLQRHIIRCLPTLERWLKSCVFVRRCNSITLVSCLVLVVRNTSTHTHTSARGNDPLSGLYEHWQVTWLPGRAQ